ncbi:N-acetyltransferase [Bacillus sp. HMF5848]|uniref:GNAT family N-acetyltransferase n=1 Tax=Bacillus sp. HMF5848 TaxID=2495421 RepID=UPI000F771989|nr:GNAT family N-acetyltransferase [Bacillus sp. HMF5848]RSK28528.1 N-acetyltransferase [Bacillus sp. HMF5848]
MLTIQKLKLNDMHETMLDGFERYQKTDKVYVFQRGLLLEKEDYFEDNWTVDNKRDIVTHLIQTINDGGAVITATHAQQIIGFAVIEAMAFKITYVYRELSYFHVSQLYRGQKIGEALFEKSKEVARYLGAEKLYIGSHPSVQTQNFYRKMGCVLATEICPEIYNREPRDIQLEIEV